MTDPAIIAASYAAEVARTWDLGDVIDSSGAVVAIGTTQESTTELKDLSGNLNHGTINGPMPDEGFFRKRIFDGVDDFLDCGNDSSFDVGVNDWYTVSIVQTIDAAGILISRAAAGWHGWRFGLLLNKVTWLVGDGSSGSSVTGSSESGDPAYDDGCTHVFVFGRVDNRIFYQVDCGEVFYTDYTAGSPDSTNHVVIGARWQDGSPITFSTDPILYSSLTIGTSTSTKRKSLCNTLAVLPFWSISYTDYPNNATSYTERLPYSSTIISAGEFKVDADVLDCLSAGTITYRAAHKFDGAEYITVTIAGIEYSGTGTITQGNTTVSIAQDSNIITIQMGTGDTIDAIDIQFRETV